jgi:hypothetical protein
MTANLIRPPLRISHVQARQAYQRIGEPVPDNLREPWPWPKGAAFIFAAALLGWSAFGYVRSILDGVLS